MNRLPTLFVAHGAPPLLDDAAWMAELRAWARDLPQPRAILMLSAHWETDVLTTGAEDSVPLIYDFGGFPRRFYEMQYPSPGVPWLAARVHELAEQAGMASASQPTRGLDHGAYVPLMAMYPDASVPVLQVSIPSRDPQALMAVGRALKPLRDEGVLIVASGLLTHNLRHFTGVNTPPPAWATAFDDWVQQTLDSGDLTRLASFLELAPHARLAHPQEDHFVPLFIAAAAAEGEGTRHPIEGWVWGPFSKRSVEFGERL